MERRCPDGVGKTPGMAGRRQGLWPILSLLNWVDPSFVEQILQIQEAKQNKTKKTVLMGDL